MIRVSEGEPSGYGGLELADHVSTIFSESGLLSRASNFEYRPQQQQMAHAVAEALNDQEHLIVEAGTGVGKSLGYLIPAILYAVSEGKRAIIIPIRLTSRSNWLKKTFRCCRKFSLSRSTSPC